MPCSHKDLTGLTGYILMINITINTAMSAEQQNGATL